MNSKRVSCTTSYRDKYIPPYERLLRRNRSWKPKKVEEEEESKRKCREGKLTPFQQPENYSNYFINRQTTIFILDELIDQAKLTNYFSMDTEGDALTKQPATIQVEFIRHPTPPIIIIIEANHLPPMNSPLFKKIQQLCSIIFTSNHTIYSWGPAKQELGRFVKFDLFNDTIRIIERDLQREHDPIQKCGLKKLIGETFKQNLDKTTTLAEWSCGLDLSLGTYLPENVVGHERDYRINEEKKYRQILTEYAINDVFAVTKLAYRMDERILSTPPETIEQDEQVDDEEGLIVHVEDELVELKGNDYAYEEQLNQQQPVDYDEQMDISKDEPIKSKNRGYKHYRKLPDIMQLHWDDDSIEMISDDELEIKPSSNIMKPQPEHRPTQQSNQQYRHEERSDEPKKVHVRDRVRDFDVLDRNSERDRILTPKQIKNRETNRRHRAKRYEFEVIRRIYHKFDIRKVKPILKAMNIDYRNFNIVRHTLFVGLRRQSMVKEVEQQLNHRVFTEQHYRRLYRE